ncbi:hypothetical protein D3C74_446370 [compost metagenome]
MRRVRADSAMASAISSTCTESSSGMTGEGEFPAIMAAKCSSSARIAPPIPSCAVGQSVVSGCCKPSCSQRDRPEWASW